MKLKNIIFISIGIGVVVAVILAYNFSISNQETIPSHILAVNKTGDFTLRVPYSNNSTDEINTANVTLIVPSVLALYQYDISDPYTREGNLSNYVLGRPFNYTYIIKYQGISGAREIKGDNLTNTSFDPIIGTDVTYYISNKLTLMPNEYVDMAFRFDTSAAEIGSYDIKVTTDKKSFLVRIKVQNPPPLINFPEQLK